MLCNGWRLHSGFLERREGGKKKTLNHQIMHVSSFLLHCRQQTLSPESSEHSPAQPAPCGSLLLQEFANCCSRCPTAIPAQHAPAEEKLRKCSPYPSTQHHQTLLGSIRLLLQSCWARWVPACRSTAGATRAAFLSAGGKVCREIQRFGMTMDTAEQEGRGRMEEEGVGCQDVRYE